MRRPRSLLWILACVLGLQGLTHAADEPPYDFPYKNGLYGTVSGTLVLTRMKFDVPGEKKMKLKVPGMRKDLEIRAVIQDQRAPVVMLLQGLGGKAKSNSARIWLKWFAEAGCHAFTFDSTFAPTFISTSRHGVSGNMRAEAGLAVAAAQTFMQLPELQGKVEKVGVVGMSYGGIQALTVGRLCTEGKVPFQIAAIQSYSPPVNMATTGSIVDRWYRQDRWNYKLSELAGELLSHNPVARDEEIPFSDSMLRATIAALFRMSLAETIDRNDSIYRLKLLPEESRQSYAEAWGFSKFIKDMVIPYWQPRLKLADPRELVTSLELAKLMRDQPHTTEVIEAVDDPFNDPAELAAVRKLRFPCRLTVLPTGGHLGYIGHPWIRANLMKLFKAPVVAVAAAPVPVVVKASPVARPKLKPAVPKVQATATKSEDRYAVIAMFAGAFRCGDKALVETALAEADRHPDYLFKTIGWIDLVAEIAARSGAEIQPLLLDYLARHAHRLDATARERVQKVLPGVNLASYQDEKLIAAWNTDSSGVDDATKALAKAVEAKDYPTARAYLQLIGKKGKLKLLAAAATVLNTEDKALNQAALAVFKPHAEILEANVESPKRCLIWWRLYGRRKLAEHLRTGP